MPKELRRRLHAVDPNLTIIPGGVRRRARRAAEADWGKAAGVICKKCGREVFRSRDGLCFSCWEKEHEFEIRDKAGILNLLPESVIMDIVHLARREE